DRSAGASFCGNNGERYFRLAISRLPRRRLHCAIRRRLYNCCPEREDGSSCLSPPSSKICRFWKKRAGVVLLVPPDNLRLRLPAHDRELRRDRASLPREGRGRVRGGL